MVEDPVDEKLPRLSCPVLVVRGGRDRVISSGRAQRVADLAPHGRLVVVPGYAHMAHYFGPLAVVPILRPFLFRARGCPSRIRDVTDGAEAATIASTATEETKPMDSAQAAGGDGQSSMRSIAAQSVEELGGPRSLLTKMRQEHAELERMLERLVATSGDEQDEVLTRLWRLVFPHAYAEETVVWPAIRAVSRDGDELTLHVEQGHQKLSELTAALDRLPPGSADRNDIIAEVVEELRLDVREEEDVLLPRLRAGVTDQQLRRLGRTWDLVRRTAPTRPHAAVSRRPPGNVIAAGPLSLVDRSRDALDRVARSRNGRGRARAEAASRALARLAGAIERLGPVRRGERAETRPGQWVVHRWLTRNLERWVQRR
jgi:hypothetical protein